jgi:hypothetical protein
LKKKEIIAEAEAPFDPQTLLKAKHRFTTSSDSNLKRWNGTTHSGQSTASCTLQKDLVTAQIFNNL